MNTQQLIDLFTNNINGASFITFDSETQVKLSGGKSNPQQGKITKVTTNNNVIVFQNKNSNGYDNMVKRRLENEGKDPSSFVLSERKWGTRIPDTCIIEHNGQYYLEVIFLNCGQSTYYCDGVQIDKQDIIGLPKTNEGQQGGLDNKVIIRTFKFDSIKKVTINKQTLYVK